MRNSNQTGIIVSISKRRKDTKKGLPKRCGSETRKLRFSQYKNNNIREKNKANRIFKDALRSSNVSKVALAQARKSVGTISFVEKILLKKNLI